MDVCSARVWLWFRAVAVDGDPDAVDAGFVEAAERAPRLWIPHRAFGTRQLCLVELLFVELLLRQLDGGIVELLALVELLLGKGLPGILAGAKGEAEG
jgi:hypothetical protein